MSETCPADRWSAGVTLFNQRHFFECHEVWEEAWKSSVGAERLFLQGMIQIAAAMVHASRGRKPGALSLWNKARAKLEMLPAEYHGIALGALMTECEEYLAAVFDGEAQPCAIPKIRQVD